VYAVLGVLWWVRDRVDRAAVARVDAFSEPTPPHRNVARPPNVRSNAHHAA
jgi:hypothetical protein